MRGGAIVAWGDTDIDDPEKRTAPPLRDRRHIKRTYHSVDPGKLTMAPYFADVCANRILAA